jgi:hypothetical protein
MAFLINSPGLITTGTTGADYFQVNSGGLGGATIQGLAGNDTVQATGGGAASAAFNISLAGGADLVTASSIGSNGVGSLLGGAGADTINISGASFFSQLNGGDGNDRLNLGSALNISGGSLNVGAGADVISANTGAFNSSTVGLGAGNDTLRLSGGIWTKATVAGGGGNDSIVFSGVELSTGLLVKAGVGTDFVRALALDSGASVKGGGGADTITLSGDATTGLNVAGGAGGDSITLDGVLAGETFFLGGGAGSDVIVVSASDNMTGVSTIYGGGGADSINVSGTITGNGVLIFGGAGADDIGIGTLVTGTGVTIAYSALTDSTIGSIDEVSGSYVSGSDVQFHMSGAVSSTTLGAYNGTDLHVTAGIATGDGFSAGSVGSAATIFDKFLTDQGQVAIFTQSGSNYFFVQGGTSGTSDDLIAEFNSGLAISGASSLNLTVSAASVNFEYES